MQMPVPCEEVGSLGAVQPAEGVLQGLEGQIGIEAGEGVAQPLLQDHLAVVVAFAEEFARDHVGAMADAPASRFQPGEGGLFDYGLGERCGHCHSHEDTRRVLSGHRGPVHGPIQAPASPRAKHRAIAA